MKSLGAKFTLALALVCAVASSCTIFMLSQHWNQQAQQAVEKRAELILNTMQAARSYTQMYVQPRLEQQNPNGFELESVPNFAARKIFETFRKKDDAFKAFSYKEAALNPTNPEDLADDFERQLFEGARQMAAGDVTWAALPYSGYRTRNGQKLFYLAQPLVMDDASCLACHGNPRNAPPQLLARYGDKNGFGWQLNEVVATQLLYVPADQIFAAGQQNLRFVTKTLASILGAVFVVINLLLWRTVILPMKTLTRTAKQISQCATSRQSPPKKNERLSQLSLQKDESGQLARAFEYMLYVLGRREQDLQLAVDEKTRSLVQEMRDRQTAQTALQTYSQAINHDLRNLVMGISTLVQGLRFRAEKSKPKERAQADKADGCAKEIVIEPDVIAMIQKSCDRQITLMNSLMDLRSSDIWRMAMQPDALTLKPFIDEIARSCEPKLLNSDVQFQNLVSAHLPLIEADKAQLQRVFENLIDNAIKYNNSGITITVDAQLLAGENGAEGEKPPMVRCTVADNGRGLLPEKVDTLFQLYTRGEESDRTEGFGLGLYICRKIIEAHGGEIGVSLKAQSGSGTEFWFTLPLCAED